MRKEFGRIEGARFYHPPTNTFGTSGHVKWHSESLHDPNLSKNDIAASIQGRNVWRTISSWWVLNTTMTRMDCYTSRRKSMCLKSPVGPVISVSRAPTMKGGLVARRCDETPVHVADVIRMTGADP